MLSDSVLLEPNRPGSTCMVTSDRCYTKSVQRNNQVVPARHDHAGVQATLVLLTRLKSGTRIVTIAVKSVYPIYGDALVRVVVGIRGSSTDSASEGRDCINGKAQVNTVWVQTVSHAVHLVPYLHTKSLACQQMQQM